MWQGVAKARAKARSRRQRRLFCKYCPPHVSVYPLYKVYKWGKQHSRQHAWKSQGWRRSSGVGP